MKLGWPPVKVLNVLNPDEIPNLDREQITKFQYVKGSKRCIVVNVAGLVLYAENPIFFRMNIEEYPWNQTK